MATSADVSTTPSWPKGTVKTADLSLGGTDIRVKTDATPAMLKQIRELVEDRFEEYTDKLQKGVTAHQLAILVSFNLAEELLKERERNRQLKKRVADWTERLKNRVESHLVRLTEKTR